MRKVEFKKRMYVAPVWALLICLAATGGAASAFEVRHEVSFAPEELVLEKLQGYDFLKLPGCDFLSEAGKPMLPVKYLRLALPEGMEATGVRMVGVTTETIAGNYTVFPAQPPLATQESKQMEFVLPDLVTYASSTPFPGSFVELVGQTDLAGQGMAVVRLNPVSYIPATGQVTLATSISFVVEGKPGYVCGDYLPPNISRKSADVYMRMLEGMVANKQDLSLKTSQSRDVTLVDPGDYDYVVITPAAWVDDFQPLADWKTRKGIPATIVTTEWIFAQGAYGDDEAEKIRSFVIDAHTSWGALYFLLGGDSDTVPPGYTFEYLHEIGHDTYYGDYDRDWVCEVNMGRASVESEDDIAVFVDKTLDYEQSVIARNYVKTAVLLGFDLYIEGSAEGEGCKEIIDTTSIPSNWLVNKEYDSEEGIHLYDSIAYLDWGHHLVNHIDHCGAQLMGMGCINHNPGFLETSHVDALTNHNRLSVFYSIGCHPGMFYYPYGPCIVEHFMRVDNAGTVAFIGNTASGYYWHYNPSGLSLRYDQYFFESFFTDDLYILGPCFSDHKNDAYTSSSVMRHIFCELTLFGDPELNVWTQVPVVPQVTHPATIPVGESTIMVHADIPYSPVKRTFTVCVWKGDEVYEVQETDKGGNAYFTVAPTTTGELLVTVTSRNCTPVLRAVKVL